MKSTIKTSDTLYSGSRRLSALIQAVAHLADENAAQDRDMTVRHLVQAFGRTSFLPALLLPAMAVVTPLSGIPLLSATCGLMITLIAAQMIAGRAHLWLPDIIMNRRLAARRIRKGTDWMAPVAHWIDDRANPRLQFLTTSPLRRLPEAICFLAGAVMPLLEVVPFSSSVLGAGIAMTAVGFLADDGLFVMIGCAVIAVMFAVPVSLLAP